MGIFQIQCHIINLINFKRIFSKQLNTMKTQAIFTLLFLFASVFKLNQAAPVDEPLFDKESISSAIDQAGLQLEKAGGWTKDDLIDVASPMILTHIKTFMTEQMDEEIESWTWKLNRILEDVGKETEEEDSNDSKDVETSTDE